MSSERITNAITNAVKWLRDNPTHHITGSLALTSDGVHCSPNDSKAECFCVLGRISKELDLETYPEGDPDFDAFTKAVNTEESAIYGLNDFDALPKDQPAACGIRERRSNQKVLNYMEELLNVAV